MRALTTAAALVVLAGACGGPPETAPPARVVARPASAPPAPPPAPRAVAVAIARGLDLYEAPHGSPLVGRVDEGEVLAWRGDGFLRVRLGGEGGRELEGFPSPLGRRPDAGVGLYATEDVPLLAADGTRVGTALRGAFVRVNRVDAERVEIALGTRASEVVVASRAGLGTTRIAPNARAARGRVVEHVAVTIQAGPLRTSTSCDEPVEALDDGRVAVVRDGVELVGTLGDVSGCRPRVVTRDRTGAEPSVPEGYERVRPFRVTAFAKKRTLWFEADGACVSEVFTPGPQHGLLEHTAELAGGTLDDALGVRGWTATYRQQLRGVQPLLTRPTTIEAQSLSTRFRDPRGRPGTPPGYGEGIALCGYPTWLVIGEDTRGVRLLADVRREVVAYHPEDVTVWYTSAEACGQAAERRKVAIARDPFAAARPSAGCGR